MWVGARIITIRSGFRALLALPVWLKVLWRKKASHDFALNSLQDISPTPWALLSFSLFSSDWILWNLQISKRNSQIISPFCLSKMWNHRRERTLESLPVSHPSWDCLQDTPVSDLSFHLILSGAGNPIFASIPLRTSASFKKPARCCLTEETN